MQIKFPTRLLSSQLLWQLLIVAFLVAIHLSQLIHFDQYPQNWLEGNRLSTTADAYYFLRLTNDYLDDNYTENDELRATPRVFPIPPLAIATAGLHKLTGYSVEAIAFFIPLAFAALLVPVVWCWSRMLMPTSLLGPFICGLACASSFAWYRRVMLGRFDTDSLNLVLIWLLFLLVVKFIKANVTRDRLAWLTSIALTIGCIAWWWPQGGLALAGMGGVVYIGSLPMESPRWEKAFKSVLAFLGLAVAFMAITNTGAWLPDALHLVIKSLSEHLELVFKSQQTEFFGIGETIDELVKPTVGQAAISLSGSKIVFGISIVGLGFLFYDKRENLVLLGIPVLAFSLMSFGGRRFLMFLVPAIALGLGYACCKALDWANHKSTKHQVAVAVVSFLLIIPSTKHSLAYPLSPTFDAYSNILASMLQVKTPKESIVWNWWGPGYLLQHEGKRKTFIDGGLQSPERVYIAAVPFATSNLTLARNWIRFFSKHPEGLSYISKFTQSKAKAAEFLIKVFQAPSRLPGLVTDYKLPPEKWNNYLFPEVNVTVAIFSDMLVRSTWLSVGRSTPGGARREMSLYVLPFSQCRFELDNGRFEYNGKLIEYGAIYQITPKRLSNSPGTESDTVAVAVPDADKLFYMNMDEFDCLAFRLLFVNPKNTPGFRMLDYNPFVGGIWRVE